MLTARHIDGEDADFTCELCGYTQVMVLDLDGCVPKLSCPGIDGMPDRLLLLPGGRIAFVELKSPGKRHVHYNCGESITDLNPPTVTPSRL